MVGRSYSGSVVLPEVGWRHILGRWKFSKFNTRSGYFYRQLKMNVKNILVS